MQKLSESMKIDGGDLAKVVAFSRGGREWDWMTVISRRLPLWNYRGIPEKPWGLDGNPSQIRKNGDIETIKTWNSWLTDIIKTRRQNSNTLGALLKCVQICRGSASEHRAAMEKLFTDYLRDEFNVPLERVSEALEGNPWDWAKRWASRDCGRSVSKDWGRGPYREVDEA